MKPPRGMKVRITGDCWARKGSIRKVLDIIPHGGPYTEDDAQYGVHDPTGGITYLRSGLVEVVMPRTRAPQVLSQCDWFKIYGILDDELARDPKDKQLRGIIRIIGVNGRRAYEKQFEGRTDADHQG